MEDRQKAIIVGVNMDQLEDFSYSMEELSNLADACGIEVVGELTQNLESPNVATYIGSGKIDELLYLVRAKQADMIIFNDELSPSQIRNLEEDLDSKIVDRTILILDIFAERARTKEAQLQVEIAQLQYMLPRLVGLRKSLSRQGGSGGAGLRNRGAGETKLELDRRKIEAKIASLSKELEALVFHRKIQRKQRKRNQIPVVALVGYTNAGKSTIMNAFMEKYGTATDKQVFEQDMLFATLQTAVRNIKLADKKEFLLTDTVGFVSKLPHHLVKAFRSTLEEVAEADLLVHVVDCSNWNHQQLIETTNQTLEKIGIKNIPVVYAYNKADLVNQQIPYVQHDRVFMSAKNRIGIEELIAVISQQVFQNYLQCEMLIPYDQGQIVSYLNEHAQILETEYAAEGTLIRLKLREADYEKYHQFVISSV